MSVKEFPPLGELPGGQDHWPYGGPMTNLEPVKIEPQKEPSLQELEERLAHLQSELVELEKEAPPKTTRTYDPWAQAREPHYLKVDAVQRDIKDVENRISRQKK